MNKKIFALILLLCVFPLAFADVDLELPVGSVFALSEIPTDGNQAYSMFFPYFEAGPLTCRYNFAPDSEASRWTFGLGGSLLLWPFQTVCASGSAVFRIKDFRNDSYLELVNALDAGIFMLFSSYYDVEQGKKVSLPYFSPALGYTLALNYHFANESPFYLGGAFRMGGADISGSFMFVYAVNLTCGFRIKTGM